MLTKDELTTLIADFCARLGRLIANGVPLVSALEAIAAENSGQPGFQLMLTHMVQSIEIGHTLASSMMNYSLFPETLITAIMNAEQKGTLDVALQTLSPSIMKGDFPLGTLPPEDSLHLNDIHSEMETIPVLFETMLKQAYQSRASDIHIDPLVSGSSIRFRIDGALHRQQQQLSTMQHNALVSRVKVLAGLDVAERKLPQDGRIITSLVFPDKPAEKEVRVDLRVSICRYFHGEKIVLRFLDREKFPTSLDIIMSGHQLETVRNWLKKPYGLILVTGPTGCGKTTTLLLMLQELAAREEINVLTVEDPVEYVLPGTNQMQIQPTFGLTFSAALRSLLRQDPDVVAIGEIRDPETAILISKTALNGHLVLSQLHNQDSVAALTLLQEIGVPLYALRQTLIGIIAQRLVRKLCPNCKKPLSDEAIKTIPEPFRSQVGTHFTPVGCDQCSFIGYKGRLPLYEVFEPNPNFWNMVAEGATEKVLRTMLKEKQMTLFDHGLGLISQGLTTWTEIERVTFA